MSVTNPRLNKLSITLWNARSINNKSDEIKNAPLGKFDLIIITESWLKDENAPSFPGYNCINKFRQNRKGGGILVYCKKNFSMVCDLNLVSKDLESCNLEYVVFTIHNTVPIINFTVVYRSIRILPPRNF